jgi:hypothetical protein
VSGKLRLGLNQGGVGCMQLSTSYSRHTLSVHSALRFAVLVFLCHAVTPALLACQVSSPHVLPLTFYGAMMTLCCSC